MATVVEERTFVPEQEHEQELSSLLDFMARHVTGQERPLRYALVGASEADRIELPREVHEALVQVVAAMQAGKAVTVAPRSMTLTSQQAADLLGVSRPTVIKLIERGELSAERVGSRHRLKLDDVLSYQEARKIRQYDAIAATSVDIDPEEDPAVVRDRLKRARREIAARRRPRT
ncbi:helix-turn-helix domain-containing protein [Nocardia vermiculata]|uniref:Helix-turn-helix domain-containing protein n=1 Tax=Nocardia vermiculata TaxID=257274 RepID=A0A846Y1X0_9NOCA|nr:helix-turn-helix domain-containing protein [Nocardia vermiculata]NKY53243.1 helix-turn-helix domain-containing protein [Nocardia vermiculata]